MSGAIWIKYFSIVCVLFLVSRDIETEAGDVGGASVLTDGMY